MNTAIIFAGGIGRRMNTKALPKQFLKLHGREIILYTLDHYEKHPQIDGIVIACVEEWIPYLRDALSREQFQKVRAIVPGGETGQLSIYNGLTAAEECFPQEDTIVLVHDGVRPLIEQKTITDCLASVRENGSAITVAPAVETIIRLEDDATIRDVIPRRECWMARAPQCFYLHELLDAHRKAQSEKRIDFIDSAEIMRHYGHSLTTVEGPVENIKITTPMDFYTFRALYEARENSQLYGL